MKYSKLLSDQDIDKKINKYYEWRDSFLGKIEDWWDNFLGYRIKDFKIGIENLIRWFPIIWNDRDWDHAYIFYVLKQKIQFTSQYNKKRKHYIGVEREIELMDLSVKLIDRVLNGYYEDLAHDEMEKKYGLYKEWEFIPIEGKPDLTQLIIEREKEHLYPKEEVDNDFRILLDIAYKKQTKAKKLLFKILDEHILHWWD